MAKTITVLEDIQIINVESFGDATIEDHKACLDTVLNIRQGRGLTRVFVDATKETSGPSTMSMYEFGSDLAARIRGMRFAIATSPVRKNDFAFLETVAFNRGGQLRVFDSVDAALAWLTEKPNK